MGAIGGAILNGAVGALVGSCAGAAAGVGMFGNNDKDDKPPQGSCIASTISYAGSMTLSGLVGWAAMNAGNTKTVMDLGRTAAALAIGGAVTACPATIAIMCIAIPLVTCATLALANEHAKENAAKEEASEGIRMRASV